MHDNRLSGTLPAALSKLTALEAMNVGYNLLSSSIPSELSNLQALEDLLLRYNHLSGTFPAVQSGLQRLRGLDLFGNVRLSGTIPPLSTLPALSEMKLGWSRLSGTLASSAAALAVVDLSSTRVSGTILPEIVTSNLTSLLYLHRARLSGTLPVELTSSLAELTLEGNRVSGTLPAVADRLATLRLNGNRLSGTLPTRLLTMPQQLCFISVESNRLSGTVPNQLGGQTSLWHLNLGDNWFSGTIPNVFSAGAFLTQAYGYYPFYPQAPTVAECSLGRIWAQTPRCNLTVHQACSENRPCLDATRCSPAKALQFAGQPLISLWSHP